MEVGVYWSFTVISAIKKEEQKQISIKKLEAGQGRLHLRDADQCGGSVGDT
jgi:hypothetical protein